MTIKPRYILIISIALLTACGRIPPATETPTITVPPSTEMMTPLPTFTPPPVAFAFSTATATFAPKPIPVSTSTETFPLDNLRMAYIVDGNLYVQDGSNSPKQLSNSGEDILPMFSDDGEKIIFYRGKTHDNNSIFSINADGSDTREIITKNWLDTLGTGTKAGHLAFVPNTHQVLFNAYLCPDDDNMSSGCTVGLFLADTDTGELKEIVKPTLGGRLPIGGDALWIRNFSISPDGKLLSVAHDGQIDILDTNGKTIHRSIMNYSPGTPFQIYPRIYWFSDLSGLIIALPEKPEYFSYTIWKYLFNGSVATQIPLNPSPVWTHMESNDVISISPNREWMIYFANDCQLYKGNLLDGSTELLLPCLYYLPMQWSSDNRHFAIGANVSEALFGSVDALPGYPPGYFLGWIDAKRFIYFPLSAYASKDDIPILVGEIDGETLSSYETKVFVPNTSPLVAFTVLESK